MKTRRNAEVDPDLDTVGEEATSPAKGRSARSDGDEDHDDHEEASDGAAKDAHAGDADGSVAAAEPPPPSLPEEAVGTPASRGKRKREEGVAEGEGGGPPDGTEGAALPAPCLFPHLASLDALGDDSAAVERRAELRAELRRHDGAALAAPRDDDPDLVNRRRWCQRLGLDPATDPRALRPAGPRTFVERLHGVLSMQECHAALRWMPGGQAWTIADKEALVRDVLPRHFKAVKLHSFTKKLKRWGFQHFALFDPGQQREMSVYTHELFQRENPGLCRQMGGPQGGNRRVAAAVCAGTNAKSHATGSREPAQQEAQLVQSLMIQQLQQQGAMMQQMQQHMQQQQQQQQGHGQNQGQALAGASAGGRGDGGGNYFHTSAPVGTGNASQNNPSAATVPTGSNAGLADDSGAFTGLRRTSLGFMPYLPPAGRQESLLGSSSDPRAHGNSGAACGRGGVAGAPAPPGAREERLARAREGGLTLAPAPAPGDARAVAAGERTDVDGGRSWEEDLHRSQAKLALLEEMLALERGKRAAL